MSTKTRHRDNRVVEVATPVEVEKVIEEAVVRGASGGTDTQCMGKFETRFRTLEDFIGNNIVGPIFSDVGTIVSRVREPVVPNIGREDPSQFCWPDVLTSAQSLAPQRCESICFVSHHVGGSGVADDYIVSHLKLRMANNTLRQPDPLGVLNDIKSLLWTRTSATTDPLPETLSSCYAAALAQEERDEWASAVNRLAKSDSAEEVSATLALLCKTFQEHQRILADDSTRDFTLAPRDDDKDGWEVCHTALRAGSKNEAKPTGRSEMGTHTETPMARVFVQVGRLYGDRECGFRYEPIADGSTQMIERFKEVLEEVKEDQTVGGLVGPSYSVVGGADKEAMEIFAGQVQLETADRVHLEIFCLPGSASPTRQSA